MTEKDILIARIGHEEEVLKTMPDFLKLDRASIESEIKQLRLQLEQLQNTDDAQPFQTTITFSGPKVYDQYGIQSDFACSIVPKYLNAVREVGKSLTRIQRDRSRIFDMIITGTVKGSFGFILESAEKENPTERDSNNQDLKNAVEKTSEILISAQQGDDALTEAADGVSETALEAIYGFAKHLHDNQSNCTIRVQEKKSFIDHVEQIEKRLNKSNIVEQDELINGYFEGILPQKRTFEFQTEQNITISGRISSELETDLRQLLKTKLFVPVQIRCATRQVGSGKKYFTIIGIEV